jgi:arylsulfatase A-like enzyme
LKFVTRELCAVVLTVVAFAVSCGDGTDGGLAPRDGTQPPNVLFILADDLRFDAVGYSGNEVIKTPNIDSLASEGMRLDRFYVAYPVCIQSRATFLTGRYHHDGATVNRGKGWRIRPETRTVANWMNDAGYVTGFIGKSHLGMRPQVWGFDHVPVLVPEDRHAPWIEHINPKLIVDGIAMSVPGHITQILTDAAIDFMVSNKDQPWFLWLATSAPHVPYHEYDDYLYNATDIVASPPPGWPPSQKLVSGRGVFDWPAYYSTISMLDEQVGRLLGRLDALGLAEDTVVVFISDNGIQLGSHGHMAKAIWYEESTKVPAVVRWPGKTKPGAISEGLASSVDLLPTLLDIAGLPSLEGMPGASLLPTLLRGEPTRDRVYSESARRAEQGGGSWEMIVNARWKYVRIKDPLEQHLYDLEEDPFEQRDLVGSPTHAATLKKLQGEMRRR